MRGAYVTYISNRQRTSCGRCPLKPAISEASFAQSEVLSPADSGSATFALARSKAAGHMISLGI